MWWVTRSATSPSRVRTGSCAAWSSARNAASNRWPELPASRPRKQPAIGDDALVRFSVSPPEQQVVEATAARQKPGQSRPVRLGAVLRRIGQP